MAVVYVTPAACAFWRTRRHPREVPSPRRGTPCPGVSASMGTDRFVANGIRQVYHWSDLDVGGLRILRQIQTLVPIEVRPYRMEPELLDRLPTQPLTLNDKASLAAWLTDGTAPARDLAQALLSCGRKAEQEGWFLLRS